MNKLLDADEDDSGYKDFPGPFTDFPSSLLEDLTDVIYQQRGLPNQTLHQLILPQLEVLIDYLVGITNNNSSLYFFLCIVVFYI